MGAEQMNLRDIVNKYLFPKDIDDVNNQASSFKRTVEQRLKIFNLSLKDFKINDEYNFTEETSKILIKIQECKLKQYANNLRKDQIQKIDAEGFNKLARLVEKLVVSHFDDENLRKNALLKIYAVETEIGTFDEGVLRSLNVFSELDAKVRSRAMNDIRLLFLEPYSKVRYQNLTEEDRHYLVTEFIGSFESEVFEFLERIKERDATRMKHKEVSAKELISLMLEEY